MSENQKKGCDICEEVFLGETDFVWCPECKLFLCTVCEITKHMKIKFATPHEMIRIDLENRKGFLCTKHAKELIYYCKCHHELYCDKCYELGHTACESICLFGKNSGWTVFDRINNVEEAVNGMSNIIENSRKWREEYLEKTIENKRNIVKSIKRVREKVYETLDKMEKHLIETCTDLFNKHEQSINSALAYLEKLDNNLSLLKANFNQIKLGVKQNTLNSLLYRNLQKLENEVKHDRSSLMNNMLRPYEAFDMELVPSMDSILLTLNSQLNELKILTNHKTVVAVSDYYQFVNQKSSVPMVHSVLSFDVGQMDKQGMEIRDCTITASGQFVFADCQNSELHVFSKEGIFNRDIPIEGGPRFVCHLMGEKIAITFTEKKTVGFVEIGNEAKYHEIQLGESCAGLSAFNNMLCVRVTGYGYYFINTDEEYVMAKVPIAGQNMAYVAFSNDKIYFTDWRTGIVACCSFNGNFIWKYQNNLLQSPNGIAVDMNENIYVSGSLSNNVIVISSYGKHVVELISSDQSFHCPLGIHFCLDTNQLVVSFSEGPAVLYDVVYSTI